MRKNFGTILVGAVLFTPILSFAAGQVDHPRVEARVDAHRYYDATHKDYHTWDAREDHAYGAWAVEQHRKAVEWNTLPARDRQAYWDWRHTHPDAPPPAAH